MKKYLKIFKNWRLLALAVIAIAAIMHLASDSDALSLFTLTKIIGISLCYFGYKIGKEWHDDGKINEINALKCDE